MAISRRRTGTSMIGVAILAAGCLVGPMGPAREVLTPAPVSAAALEPGELEHRLQARALESGAPRASRAATPRLAVSQPIGHQFATHLGVVGRPDPEWWTLDEIELLQEWGRGLAAAGLAREEVVVLAPRRVSCGWRTDFDCALDASRERALERGADALLVVNLVAAIRPVRETPIRVAAAQDWPDPTRPGPPYPDPWPVPWPTRNARRSLDWQVVIEGGVVDVASQQVRVFAAAGSDPEQQLAGEGHPAARARAMRRQALERLCDGIRARLERSR